MKLVILFGASAVGKTTVGQVLAKITDLKLFHSHMGIEPVIEIFGRRDIPTEDKIRIVSHDKEIPFENYIKIDNTHLQPEKVADIIKNTFSFM